MAKKKKSTTRRTKKATGTKKASKSKSKKKITKKPASRKSSTTKKSSSSKKSTSKKSTSKKSTGKKSTRKKTSKKSTKKRATRKTTTEKKAAAKAKAAAPNGRPSTPTKAKEITVHKGKSPLNKKELEKFRALLLVKRAELLGDVDSMSNEALRLNDSANLSHMPIHMADVGSDNFEQELTLGLVESERRMVAEIDEALDRISEGTFGICVESGKPITKARLDAKPWAKYCIEVAREMERNGNYR